MQYLPYIVLFLTNLALLGLLVFREIQHQKLTLDLTTKIKALDVNEYVLAMRGLGRQQDVPPITPPIPLEEADPEEALKAIQEDLIHDESLEEE